MSTKKKCPNGHAIKISVSKIDSYMYTLWYIFQVEGDDAMIYCKYKPLSFPNMRQNNQILRLLFKCSDYAN